MKITDCQPDLGNPTVRDERGAYGNVSYGGTRNPLHTPKGCRTETLCLRLRAPYFYPTSRACMQRGDLGTWENHLSPCDMPGKGDRATKGPGVAWGLPPGCEPMRDTTHTTAARKVSGSERRAKQPETGREGV